MTSISISVVIPALNEEFAIGATVRTAALFAPNEIVVVDACSTDATAAEARRAGARVIEHKGPRGAALNHAVVETTGSVIVFLHADTRVDADGAATLRRQLRDSRVVGGAFRLRFDTAGPVLATAARLANLRTRAFGVAYGDQAIFVRRSVFDALGGFQAWPLWDDAEFSHRLSQHGRFALLGATVTTSARRHIQHGPLRTCARIWWLTLRFRAGTSPERLASAWPPVRPASLRDCRSDRYVR